MDRVFCNDEFGFVVVVAARVQVAVPTWEIGARDVQPDPMTRTEIVARDVQIQADPIDLAGAHAQVQIKAFPLAHAQRAFLHIECPSVRINVH